MLTNAVATHGALCAASDDDSFGLRLGQVHTHIQVFKLEQVLGHLVLVKHVRRAPLVTIELVQSGECQH